MSSALIINGDRIPVADWSASNDFSELEPWKQEVYDFIQAWLSDQEYFDIPTSGSTGRPKIIRVHRSDMIMGAQMTVRFLNLRPGKTALLCLPVKYIAGKMMLVRAIEFDLNLVIQEPSSNPLRLLRENVDFAAFTPFQLHHILADPITRERLSRIPTVIIGGGSIIESMDLSMFKNEIYHTYGMTETLSHIAMRKLCGIESQWEDYRLISEDFQIELDKHDCLVIHTPFRHAPLLETNDVVELVADDAFVWKSRIDNVINSGGIKLYPEVIEKKLFPEFNRRFFISGVSDPKLGQKAILLIEGKPLMTEKELLDKLSNHLEKYEVPKSVHYLDHFTYTETQKINRGKTLAQIMGT